VYPSSRPPLHISDFSPALVDLSRTGQIWVVCPTCRTWQRLRRAKGGKVITPHRCAPRDEHERRGLRLIEMTGGTLPRCPDAARLVEVNLTPAQWRARLMDMPRDADMRRANRAYPCSTSPVPTPVFRPVG